MVFCVRPWPVMSPSAAVREFTRWVPRCLQVQLLRGLFAKALGEEGARAVDINTIDGFQGREKDVVLFSCVRSGK